MRKRTPQEKKELSLTKDRRNIYGESPHSSRKNIKFRKKARNRSDRHQQEAALPTVPVQLDADEADSIETKLRKKAPPVWDKCPDLPLGTVVKGDLAYRRRKQESSQALAQPSEIKASSRITTRSRSIRPTV